MIYLDNQATTPMDPVALSAMMPLMQAQFANAGSITHQAGRDVAQLVNSAVHQLAASIGATADELVMTSGATESNNLALLGVMHHPRQKRRRIVSLVTEHKAILDPLERLSRQGFEVDLVPVYPQLAVAGLASLTDQHTSQYTSQDTGQDTGQVTGQVDWQRLERAITDQTALVTVMLANNEIGVIQPLAGIAQLCRKHGALLHTDATQAVGKIPVDVDQLDVDLLSFSAHKFYGPKGVGGLYVRRRDRMVRLQPQIVGGGQQNNWRSGTLNTAGIIGMQAALEACISNLQEDRPRIAALRDHLFERLSEFPQLALNGPPLESQYRLEGNLNCSFYPLEGQSLMLHAPDLAVSSGSACTSANPEPSHVLRSLGLSDDLTRSSLRFGIGRFNTLSEIDLAADMLLNAASQLREMR
jgi:cysteine desulfurase